MPSQIKVDEIKNVAGQYEIKTDTFKGQSTAGSINVQGEGSATTNLQQGLVKSWLNFDGTGTPAPRDSFNHSSITDVSQGNYTVTMSSAMGNTNYSFSSGTADTGVGAGCRMMMFGLNLDSGTLDANFTTTSYSLNALYTNSGGDEYDVPFIATQIFGDLA